MSKFFVSVFVMMFSLSAQAETRTVNELVSEALSKNPEVAIYEAEIQAAKANHSVAGSLQNPELNFGIGRNKIESPAGDSSGSAFTAGINQPLDWPGRRSLKESIAKGDVELAELGLERFKFNLASKVRVLAQKIAAGQNISKAAKQVAGRYGELKGVLGQRRPAGVAPQVELSAIEAAAVVAQLKAVEADVAVQADMMELNRITGMNITDTVNVTETSFNLQKLPSDAELFRMAAENNYDIRIRRSELEQQGFKVDLAENERYPTFTVGPFISRENADEKQTIIGMNLSVPIPLWDGGSAKVSSAKARQSQAETNLNLEQREIEKKLVEAALLFRTHQSRLAVSNVSAFSGSAAEAERHYQLGGVPTAIYITMQDKYLEAVEAVNNARIKGLEAGLMIEEMTGAPGSVVKLEKE